MGGLDRRAGCRFTPPFAARFAYLPLGLFPQPVDALFVALPTATSQQRPHPPRARARMPLRHALNFLSQVSGVVRSRLVVDG